MSSWKFSTAPLQYKGALEENVNCQPNKRRRNTSQAPAALSRLKYHLRFHTLHGREKLILSWWLTSDNVCRPRNVPLFFVYLVRRYEKILVQCRENNSGKGETTEEDFKSVSSSFVGLHCPRQICIPTRFASIARARDVLEQLRPQYK